MLSRGSYLPRSTLASQRIRDWADPPEAGNDAKRRCERAGYQDLEDIEPITVCDLHRDLAAPSRAPTLVFANPAAPVNGLDVLSAKGRLIGKIRRSQAKRILSSRGVATKRPQKTAFHSDLCVRFPCLRLALCYTSVSLSATVCQKKTSDGYRVE
jgi:hypothetical protein